MRCKQPWCRYDSIEGSEFCAEHKVDWEARTAGWEDQAQRQAFLDSVRELAESIRRLAEAIKNK